MLHIVKLQKVFELQYVIQSIFKLNLNLFGKWKNNFTTWRVANAQETL